MHIVWHTLINVRYTEYSVDNIVCFTAVIVQYSLLTSFQHLLLNCDDPTDFSIYSATCIPPTTIRGLECIVQLSRIRQSAAVARCPAVSPSETDVIRYSLCSEFGIRLHGRRGESIERQSNRNASISRIIKYSSVPTVTSERASERKQTDRSAAVPGVHADLSLRFHCRRC